MKEIADQTIEEAGVIAKEHAEAVAQALARLVGDEGQVGRHDPLKCPAGRSGGWVCCRVFLRHYRFARARDGAEAP